MQMSLEIHETLNAMETVKAAARPTGHGKYNCRNQTAETSP